MDSKNIETGSFEMNKIDYEFCLNEIDKDVYTVVIPKSGMFGTTTTYTFSSCYAAIIFIHFLKYKLQNDNFQYLNKISESIDTCLKFGIVEFFEMYAPPIIHESIAKKDK